MILLINNRKVGFMKVIKIQTYKKSLVFSFKEQDKINTDLTMFTTKINLEELVFSFKYILKNKKLVLKFLDEIINDNDINKIISIQKKIINNVKKYVKVNGILLYSTCTINKYENEWMIKDFLKENENFSLLDEKIILPSDTSDGFYICKMKRIK